MTTPTLATYDYAEGSDSVRLIVKGGLHFIRGNRAPYFTLTADGYVNGRSEFGGCCHEEILKHGPHFADLVALHLSDIDGAPMHALENGFYWLRGSYEFGVRVGYSRHLQGDPPEPWEKRLETAAKHFRVTPYTVTRQIVPLMGDGWSQDAGFMSAGYAKAAKLRVSAWVDDQRPRWKREAEACIAKHGLVVFGDTYVPEVQS